MNLKLVFRILAVLLLIIAGFMSTPVLFAIYYQEYSFIAPFIKTIVIMGFTSLGILFLTRNTSQESLSTRGGLLLVSLSWSVVSFFSALPFYFSHTIPHFTDAFFETMSGYTTTGASILTSIEQLPYCILFWRSLTHWLGGMGIIVLTVAILPLLGIGGLKLIRAEAPGPIVEKITPRIAETAKLLWGIYIFFTVLETVLLMVGGLNLFEALTHTFGTLATGGFSPKNASVGHYQSAYVHWVITFFMLMAGINFSLHFRLLTGKVGSFFKDTELKVYLSIFLIATALISFNLYKTQTVASWFEGLQFASFQSASILTTTGFATANFEAWPFFSQVILFLLMFIGGCSGSTGGGIKVIRLYTLFKQGLHEIKYLIHPRGAFSLSIGGKSIKKDIVYAISGFFFLYIFILLIITLIVGSVSNDIPTAFSTALATLGNIGPGFGSIGPAENYAFFPAHIKWVLCVAMLIGRLEIYTVFCLFIPFFWKTR